MKKSEKEKGKDRVNTQKNQVLMVIGGAIIALVIITAVGYLFFNPSGARTGDRVSVYFSGTLDNGTLVGSNFGTSPLVLTLGKEETIPYGLSDAVIGMQVNQTKEVRLPAEKAFGVFDPALIQTVNRSALPPGTDLVPGQDYQIVRKSDNAVAHVTIVNVTEDTITWDGNHALAGQNLTLKITLAGITRT